MAEKVENRGGRREGAGRPPTKRPQYSQKAKERTWEAITSVADELGYDVFELLVRTASVKRGKAMTVQGQNAMKIIKDILTNGESQQQIDVSHSDGPGIYLPEKRPVGEPAKLKVVEKKAG